MEPANDKRALRQREGSRTAEVLKYMGNFSVLNQIAAIEIRGKPRKSEFFDVGRFKDAPSRLKLAATHCDRVYKEYVVTRQKFNLIL
jgi:hypothetical protein